MFTFLMFVKLCWYWEPWGNGLWLLMAPSQLHGGFCLSYLDRPVLLLVIIMCLVIEPAAMEDHLGAQQCKSGVRYQVSIVRVCLVSLVFVSVVFIVCSFDCYRWNRGKLFSQLSRTEQTLEMDYDCRCCNVRTEYWLAFCSLIMLSGF